MVAAAFVQELIDLGVRDAVVCPGSRSQALALMLAEAERDGLLRLHVRVDERSAGFLALGLARGSGGVVAVVTTSGSAVVNLWPAVIEAHHDGVPLLLVTADRPEELLGVGANQTTQQAGIFGFAVRGLFEGDAPNAESVDAVAAQCRALARSAVRAATEDIPGPVQVNLAFREPLSGAHPPLRRAGGAQAAETAPGVSARSDSRPIPTAVVAADEGTVVVAGSGAGREAARMAEAAGLPLIAEVVSGARNGLTVVPHYRAALGGSLGARVRRVVVFGRPTLSREVARLCARSDVETIVVDPDRPEPFRPNSSARLVRAVRFEDAAPEPWLEAWRSAPNARGGAAAEPADARASIALAVWGASSTGDSLYVAASAMVRVLDEWAPHSDVRVFANRGVAGIDGTVSTAIGVACATGGLTRALVGDLAFLHDAGGLMLPEGESLPPVQFVVANDGGGSIFRGLEVASADPALFRRVIETPHSVDIASIARGYGWPFLRVDDVAVLPRALAEFGPGIIEVPVG